MSALCVFTQHHHHHHHHFRYKYIVKPFREKIPLLFFSLLVLCCAFTWLFQSQSHQVGFGFSVLLTLYMYDVIIYTQTHATHFVIQAMDKCVICSDIWIRMPFYHGKIGFIRWKIFLPEWCSKYLLCLYIGATKELQTKPGASFKSQRHKLW